jgi:hypothetical protein
MLFIFVLSLQVKVKDNDDQGSLSIKQETTDKTK